MPEAIRTANNSIACVVTVAATSPNAKPARLATARDLVPAACGVLEISDDQVIALMICSKCHRTLCALLAIKSGIIQVL